jgi:tellurite methyltransferase
MEADRKRWNAKYQEGGGAGLVPPDSFLIECLDSELLIPGCAVDLAAGSGRHALELARRGWRSAAWDISDQALARIDALATGEGLVVETKRLDLEEPFSAEASGSKDLVVIVNYLDRALLARAHELLRVGGYLLFATFTTDREGQHPSDRWCLAPGELRAGLPGFATLRSREEGGRAGLLARLEARP